MSIVLVSSGGGQITLLEPTTASNFTQTLPAATGTVMVSGNMPAFSAYASANQTISSGVWTKIQFQTEEFDTASAYDNATNYRFTPQAAGYYQVNGQLNIYAGGSAISSSLVAIYKNGTGFKRGTVGAFSNTEIYVAVSALVYLNGTTDYIELYANTTSGAAVSTQGALPYTTYFQACLLRSA